MSYNNSNKNVIQDEGGDQEEQKEDEEEEERERGRIAMQGCAALAVCSPACTVDEVSISCASDKTAKIFYLPEELLVNIFEFMGPHDLIHVSSVCQLWRSLAVSDKFWASHFKSLADREQAEIPDGLRLHATATGPVFSQQPQRNFRQAYLLHQKKLVKQRRVQRMREMRTPGQKRMELFARYLSPIVYLLCLLVTTVFLSLYLDEIFPQTFWFQVLTYVPVGLISMPLFFITGLIWLLKDTFILRSSHSIGSFMPVSMAELDSSGTLTWFFLLWMNVAVVLVGAKMFIPPVHQVVPWSVLFIPVQLAHVVCCLFFFWNFIYDDIEELRTMMELDPDFRLRLKDVKGFSAVAVAVSPFVLYLMGQLQLIALFLDNIIESMTVALIPTWLLLVLWMVVVPIAIVAYFWHDSKCMASMASLLPCAGLLPTAFFVTLAITVDGTFGLPYFVSFSLLALTELEFVLGYYGFVWLVTE